MNSSWASNFATSGKKSRLTIFVRACVRVCRRVCGIRAYVILTSVNSSSSRAVLAGLFLAEAEAEAVTTAPPSARRTTAFELEEDDIVTKTQRCRL